MASATITSHNIDIELNKEIFHNDRTAILENTSMEENIPAVIHQINIQTTPIILQNVLISDNNNRESVNKTRGIAEPLLDDYENTNRSNNTSTC